jgi:hypothetical protein
MTTWGTGNEVPDTWKANHGCPTGPHPTRESWYPPTRTFLTLRRRRQLIRALARVTTSVRREQV